MSRTPWPVAALAVLVPLGPVVDYPFLGLGRWIYATEVLIIALLAAWLLQRAGVGSGPPHEAVTQPAAGRSCPRMPVLLFAGYAVAGLVALAAGQLGHASWPAASTMSVLRSARVLLLAGGVLYAAWATMRAEAVRSRILRLWTASTLLALCLITTYGIIQRIGILGTTNDPGSFYGSSVALAVHIAIFSPVALCLWLGSPDRRWRWAGAAAWAASVLCLPLTASRGALGSVLLTSILAVLLVARGTRGLHRGWIASVMAVIAIGALSLVLYPELAGETFAHKLQHTLAGDLFSSRSAAWRDASAAILAHPLTGEHPGAWAPALPLELARRHGIPAALLALVAIGSGAWAAGRWAWRQDAAAHGGRPPSVWLGWGIALGLIGFLLVGLAETALGARSTPLVSLALAIASTFPSPRSTQA